MLVMLAAAAILAVIMAMFVTAVLPAALLESPAFSLLMPLRLKIDVIAPITLPMTA